MNLTRRCWLASWAAAPLPGADEKWTAEWDREIVSAAVEGLDRSFDEKESMLVRSIGAEYHYHTSLRSTRAHPTRDSLDYALLLLEAGRRDRARRIIDRILAIQETDPAGKWYGLWGYYLEEPAPKMSPADWNWADFNGSLLLAIEHRHGRQLPDELRSRVREGIRHAANSVRRRNVSMNYTNIAVQGTFVTLAAAALLGDRDLWGYATDRLRRFARTVDETGSFAEYNSPTYANVTVTNLTRIRTMVKDEEAAGLAGRIHHRAWLHLGKHWHVPSRQLAGPHSRSYSTDIGAPLWIQKALNGRLAFAALDDLKSRRVRAPGEVGVVDFRCPEALAPLFLAFDRPRQHRELFLPAAAPVRPVQGTTWLDAKFCLGSANRGNFWVQQRPLTGYWGPPGGGAKYIQLRFLKDGYDFTSAQFYSVQERNWLLALVNFRSPGGDKHPSLDPVVNGEFEASRLRLRLDLAGYDGSAKTGAANEPVVLGPGGIALSIHFRKAVFGPHGPRLSAGREGAVFAVSLDLLPEGGARIIRWKETREAWVVLTIAMGVDPDKAAACPFTLEQSGAAVQVAWKTPAGELSLTGGTAPSEAGVQDRAFSDKLDGQPVPIVRLSEERLV